MPPLVIAFLPSQVLPLSVLLSFLWVGNTAQQRRQGGYLALAARTGNPSCWLLTSQPAAGGREGS